MLFKIMGVLDFICGFSIIFNDSVPVEIMRLLALVLIGKGSLFALGGDIASYVDIVCAVYLLALSLGAYNVAISAFAAIFLMQKAILTFVS